MPPIRTLRGLTHAYTPGEIKSNESTAGIRKMFHRTALCIHALIHKNRSYPDWGSSRIFCFGSVHFWWAEMQPQRERERERLILEEYKTAQWRSSSTFFLISCRDKRSSAAVPTGWNQHLLQCETTVSALCQEFAAGHLLCALVTFLLHFPTLKSESSFFKWPGDRIAPAQRGLTAAPPFIANQRG